MEMIEGWNGASACMLQAALRMSNEAFAAHLGGRRVDAGGRNEAGREQARGTFASTRGGTPIAVVLPFAADMVCLPVPVPATRRRCPSRRSARVSLASRRTRSRSAGHLAACGRSGAQLNAAVSSNAQGADTVQCDAVPSALAETAPAQTARQPMPWRCPAPACSRSQADRAASHRPGWLPASGSGGRRGGCRDRARDDPGAPAPRS
jgi:hypothetical protein